MGTQLQSYDTVGKKEDVSSIISNISPTKTPFTSLIGSETVHNTLFQWQEDSLRAAAQNAALEGFTASPTARATTVMRSNVTQILQDTYQVAGTTDAVSHYGRAKESAYQTGKAMAALKRDQEYIMVGLDQASVAGNSSTARKMATVYQQIDPSLIFKTGATTTVISESILLNALQASYQNGAEPSIIMCTPGNARNIADFAKASGRYRTIPNGGKERALVNVIDLYVSPYGEQKVVLNRFIKGADPAVGAVVDTLIFEPAMWKKVVLRPWFRETLAKTGDNTSMMIVSEQSLKHLNFLASSVIRESA